MYACRQRDTGKTLVVKRMCHNGLKSITRDFIEQECALAEKIKHVSIILFFNLLSFTYATLFVISRRTLSSFIMYSKPGFDVVSLHPYMHLNRSHYVL